MIKQKSIFDKLLSDRSMGTLVGWLCVFTAFFYPLSVFLILTMGVPSTPVNVGFRAASAAVSLLAIALWILNPRHRLKLLKPAWFLFIFWFFYTIRLLYDIEIAGVKFGGKPKSLIYGFAFGNILLPLIATTLWIRQIKTDKIIKVIYWFLILANVLTLITLIKQNGGFSISMFYSRANAFSDANKGDESILNPITIGFFGGLLSTCAIYSVLIVKRSKIWIHLPIFVLGLLLLVLGASRGPFVSTFLTMIICLMYRFRISYSKSITFMKLGLGVFLIVLTLNKTVLQNFSLDDFQMYNRMSKFMEDQQKDRTEKRDLSFASAWQDFLDSPIIGKQFVGTFDNFYPHNIILELFMATGLIGAFLFFGFLLPVLYKMLLSYINRDNEYFFFALLFCPILIGRMFSGALFMSIDLWLIMTLMISMRVKPKARIIHVRESVTKPKIQERKLDLSPG